MVQLHAVGEDAEVPDGADIVVGGADLEGGVENAGGFEPVGRSNVQALGHQVDQVPAIIRGLHDLDAQVLDGGLAQIGGNGELVAEGSAGSVGVVGGQQGLAVGVGVAGIGCPVVQGRCHPLFRLAEGTSVVRRTAAGDLHVEVVHQLFVRDDVAEGISRVHEAGDGTLGLGVIDSRSPLGLNWGQSEAGDLDELFVGLVAGVGVVQIRVFGRVLVVGTPPDTFDAGPKQFGVVRGADNSSHFDAPLKGERLNAGARTAN